MEGLPTPAEVSSPEKQLEAQPEGVQNEELDQMPEPHHATMEDSMEDPSPVQDPSVAGSRRNLSRLVFIAVGWTFSILVVFTAGTLIHRGSSRERFADGLHAISNLSTDSSSAASQIASPPSLELHAKRQNGDLELNWSSESALIATATSGVISIQDGASRRQFTLDSAQVRGGSVLYSPTSDQIMMQLTVPTPAGAVTESVMVVLPKVGSPQTYPVPASRPLSASVAPPQALSNSVPPGKGSKPLGEATPSPGPPVPVNSTASGPNLDRTGEAEPSLVSQTAAPPPPVTLSRSLEPDSQQPDSVAIRYQPAIAITKTAPVFPSELQTLALARKVIGVKVAIDKNGTVTNAEAIPQKNVSQFLVSSAVNAARSWRFQPALRNDEPVSSETLLQFVFDH